MARGTPAREPALVDVTISGCDLDEVELFREKGPYFGTTPIVTAAPVSESTVDLSAGSRCISVRHTSAPTNPTPAVLRGAGVRYFSTRSVGLDHLDVEFARSVGVTGEGVAYSPDSIADFTLMLMPMAVRQVTSTLRRADAHDYRLNETRDVEPRARTLMPCRRAGHPRSARGSASRCPTR